jgi:mannose-6-phosphate isomerase-like protein (cupin superfamily)
VVVEKIDIGREAGGLSRPFQVADLGYVDDFSVSVFVCHGALDWHRHIDQDELFLVQGGLVTLESEWGNTRLRPDEMAVVPKGVAHRSSSFLWSTVLLFRPRVMPHRRNGDRRSVAPSEGRSLHKVSAVKAAQQLTEPFKPVDLVTVEDCVVRLALIQGVFPWHRHTRHDELFLMFEGDMTLATEGGDLSLSAGEMAIVPKGMRHRPTAAEQAVVLLFEKKALVSTGN